MPSPADREKALESALAQIDKQFGKGSVMRLGSDERAPVEVIPTGSIALDVAEIDSEFAADDRLDAVARHLVGEFQRPEHVVGIGQRQRRLLVGLGKLGEPRNRQRAFQQRIG